MRSFDKNLLTLRSCKNSDKEFIYNTKKITMRAYVEKIWNVWDEDFQKERFNTNFNIDLTQIIHYLGKDVGILIVDENSDSIHVNNIQILPKYQNLGIGSYLLQKIIAKAKHSGKSVTLQVLKSNLKAKKLYERLGFKIIKDADYHFQMKIF